VCVCMCVCFFLVSLLVDLGLFGHFCFYYKEFDILIFFNHKRLLICCKCHI
jgi:hypothetical protein